ncbi:MAG: hypothetical protein HY978_00790 [Candidatus Liptonbacteria bacterium]|nr:hypothetical protein [Candidatus Liptonbacteria bacterium]
MMISLGNGGNSSLPNVKLLLAGLGAGVLNGIGMICCDKLLGTPGTDVSRVVPIVSGLMHVLAFTGACLILGEPVTARKITGVAAIIL